MTPVPQPPSLRFYRSLDHAHLDGMIRTALQWRETTGWPTKAQDLALAAQLYVRYREPTECGTIHAGWHEALAQALFEELSRRHPAEEVAHRHLLCLLIIEGASRGLGFNA